jgi:succinate dehydrogenase flavin-adding protein (antitoxin of CptAB toxin-antitoxin module)
MTLANEIKKFIVNYIKSTDLQQYSGYEDLLEDTVNKLFSLCTTEEEREIVKAVISLEDH